MGKNLYNININTKSEVLVAIEFVIRDSSSNIFRNILAYIIHLLLPHQHFQNTFGQLAIFFGVASLQILQNFYHCLKSIIKTYHYESSSYLKYCMPNINILCEYFPNNIIDSLLFCVLPCKHFFNNSSLLKPINIGLVISLTVSGNPC